MFCIGSGNEGNAAIHTGGILTSDTPVTQEFSVGTYEPSLNLQLWKSFADDFDIYLQHPDGTTVGPVNPVSGTQRLSLPGTELLLFYGMPSPFAASQEIYFDFLPSRGNSYLSSGIWSIRLVPKRIIHGAYDLWLPGGGSVGRDTRFLTPVPATTLTIPSTSFRAVTVGAYNSRLQSSC